MANTVEVRARTRGQKPDGKWAQEGETFSVDPDAISLRWMKPANAAAAKAFEKVRAKGAGDDAKSLKAELAKTKTELKAALAEVEALKAAAEPDDPKTVDPDPAPAK